MLSRTRAVFAVSSVLALALVSACSDDPAGLDEIAREEIVGAYAATTFTARSGNTTVDLLSGGASLDVTLLEDGTTTGRLFVPAALAGGTAFDQSLVGTFEFDDSNNEVTFDHAADTFVKDVTFTASRNGNLVQLGAEHTVTATTVRVVLRPTP
jgi:hypothetical protein